jgi:hypothetical protein
VVGVADRVKILAAQGSDGCVTTRPGKYHTIA